MKGFIFFAHVYSWLIFTFPPDLAAQTAVPFPNYVVIGAFAHQKNAINFTDDARHQRFAARFEMNPNRNLYYVYVLTTDNREYAVAEALKLRTETKYFDTWVYSGVLGDVGPIVSGERPDQDFDPATGQRIESVKSEQNEISGTAHSLPVTNKTPRQVTIVSGGNGQVGPGDQVSLQQQAHTSQIPPGNSQVNMGKETSSDPQTVGNLSADPEQELLKATPQDSREEKHTSAVQGPPPKRISTEPLVTEEVVGKDFHFYLFRADNGARVEGDIDAIDFEKSRKMATYPANKAVAVRMPSGKLKQVSFICQVFGYRKLQKEFDPANPADDLYMDDMGSLVVPFELVRLQKGDIAIMYNVFFFKDAAVMRPESRYEVNNLLELLNENPSYKIRIHGHTNGNAGGKIIRMDKPDNFYSLSGTKQGVGSARKLSEERALVIKEYLVSSGVSEDRMEVKAWGGKKPIHDKHSVRANENVRVEIEIL